MRLTVISPDHVLLRHRPPLRWLLLATGAALTWPAVLAAFRLELTAGPVLAVCLGLLLVLGGIAAVRAYSELEISPTAVCWRRRGPFALRARILRFDRACLDAVQLRADIVAGRLQREAVRHMSYEVDLRGRAPMPESIALYENIREWRARRFALALCQGAGLDLLDATGEVAVRREVGALRGPPPQRSPAPSGPAPAGLEITPDPLHGEVMTVSRWSGRREVVWLADGELHVVRRWFTLPWRHHRRAGARVDGVRVQRRHGESRHLQPGVAIVTAGRALLLGRGLPLATQRWLQAWLENRLWPEAPTRPQSSSPPPGRAEPVLAD